MKKLTKTDFRLFVACPREFWLKVNRPELLPPPTQDELFRMKQGYEVQALASRLLRQRNDREYEFERTVESEGLTAKLDAFAEDPDGSCELIEVKSSKFVPEDAQGREGRLKEHLYDLAFQLFVAWRAGLNVTKTSLVTLNGDYKLGDELDLERLFVLEDHFEAAAAMQEEIGDLVSDALRLLEEGPGEGFDPICTNKLRCLYFRHFRPGLPDTSVFDIPRITAKRLEPLVSNGILALDDVPDDADLTATQWEWVRFRRSKGASFDREAIAEVLELEYPLYFLDYEAINPAVPVIRGTSPHQQVTFQYSVHKIKARGEALQHYEFLSEGDGDPLRQVAENLSNVIGPEGNIVVWFERFEKERNAEMGELHPEYAEFMSSVNDRVFDLYEVFNKGLFRDPEMPNNKLKTVLPRLVPELSYADLEIRNGGVASVRWFEEVFRGVDEEQKTETLEALRRYCELDTLAMVRIMDYLLAL